MTKYTQAASTHVADAGSLAEEVFSSIRTAQAFGAQETLVNLFDGYVKKAGTVGIIGAKISSLGLAIMFFVIYAGYALAFFYGGVLVSLLTKTDRFRRHKLRLFVWLIQINQDRVEAGDVITVFLSILIGSFSMGMWRMPFASRFSCRC
jgi:ATP-binding cassette subfamily B (MDR/TAP) protein 1